MKAKQRPTAATGSAAVAARSLAYNQRIKDDEATRLMRQRNAQPICERERRHEAARREREEQAQHKREPTARKATQTQAQPLRRLSRDREPRQHEAQAKFVNVAAKVVSTIGKTVPTAVRTVPTAAKPAAAVPKAASTNSKSVPTSKRHPPSSVSVSLSGSSSDGKQTAQLKLHLEHLTKLTEQDFERELRRWLLKEGMEGKLTPQMGQLLKKASTPHCLLLSPLALALHTLVAEFLFAQNCHYTLSVFCSEMPHRHTLPDFESRPHFRFSQDELQQVLTAVLGTQHVEQPKFGELVLSLYSKSEQSLLLALLQALIAGRAKATSQVSAMTQTTEADQLEDKNLSVFVGPRIGQSLDCVDQQLAQLMKAMQSLSKSCAPPVEVISASALDQLLQQELQERARLTSLGETYSLEQALLKLPEHALQPRPQAAKSKETSVPTSYGVIQLPDRSPVVPKLPQLQEQQLASLATVQQTLQQLCSKPKLPPECMIAELQRLEDMVGQLASCMHSLSNVLNLAMEQEYAVGRNKGFKLGYREGFNHGHFMGVQEGEQLAAHKQQQAQEQKASQLQHASTQTQQTPVQLRTSATQTRRRVQRQMFTNTEQLTETATCQNRTKDASIQCAVKDVAITLKEPAGQAAQRSKIIHQRKAVGRWVPVAQNQAQSLVAATRHAGVQTLTVASRDAGVQTLLRRASATASETAERSYEQWIFEMLHSRSGLIFLERVELSLNKALEQQKRRLDELFEIKLRHHGELLRLNRRQKSWRTLCRHVERDTDSTEANELAQRIFRLLEHYEAHHKLLSEKIQETELAAEQTAYIEPVWNNSTFTVSEAESVAGSGSVSPQPAPHPTPEPAKPAKTKSAAQPNALLTRPPAKPAASPAKRPSAPLTAEPATLPTAEAAAPTTKRPAAPLTAEPAALPAAEAAASAPLRPASSLPAATVAAQPAKPLTRSVATNTFKLSQLPAEARPTAVSSYKEALLSAKSRMLQLEQESNLLEQSFLSYLERARAQDEKYNIRASCARERQQLHRTLDSFREWQRRMQREDVLQPSLVPPSVSPVLSLAEQEPENYQFTNAIAKARQKLLAELQLNASAAVELPVVVKAGGATDKLLLDQMQSETQQLLSRMELTLARVSKRTPKHDEPLDLDALSSVTATSLTGMDSGAGGDDGVSHKLQRSMAKMQRLFGSHAEAATALKSPAYVPLKLSATRPWSAPTNKLPTLLPPRPHTAPSSRTDAPAAATNLIHLLDALSDVGDTTVYSSSLGSSLDLATHSTGLPEVYAQLVANATTPSHASSSSSLAHSLDFWKRMNL